MCAFLAPSGKFRGRRAESDASALRGLGNVGFGRGDRCVCRNLGDPEFRLSAELRHVSVAIPV